MPPFELFELCATAAQPPMGEGVRESAPPCRFEAEDFQLLKAPLFWPSLVSAVLTCPGLLQGFAAS